MASVDGPAGRATPVVATHKVAQVPTFDPNVALRRSYAAGAILSRYRTPVRSRGATMFTPFPWHLAVSRGSERFKL